MDPLTAGLAVGGTSGIFGILAGQQTNEANQNMVNQQEAFQQQMSNTAYQRSVSDMEKAGLNPGLMFGSGAAASTPSGAIAPMTSPLASLPGAISHGADTAIAMRGQNSQLALQDAQADVAGAQADNLDKDTENKGVEQMVLRNQTQSTAQDIKNKQMTNTVLEKTLNAQIKKANAEGDYAQVNQLMGIINSGASSAASLVNPLGSIMKSLPTFPDRIPSKRSYP